MRARSGLALKKGLALANGVGTIDADYRGEVGVILVNLGAEPVTLSRGERIAQLVVAPVVRALFEKAPGLNGTVRAPAVSGRRGRRDRGRLPRFGLYGELRGDPCGPDDRPPRRGPLAAAGRRRGSGSSGCRSTTSRRSS